MTRRNEILADIGQEELNNLAREHLDVADMIIVVVGDKQTIFPGLKELGYDIVELDADGNLAE